MNSYNIIAHNLNSEQFTVIVENLASYELALEKYTALAKLVSNIDLDIECVKKPQFVFCGGYLGA